MDASIIEIYKKCSLKITNFNLEEASKNYDGCKFELNNLLIISRKAKITPTKVGQFVTFWKRNKNGIIEPFHEKDTFDFYVVTVKFNNLLGQFVFPKAVLIQQGIISTKNKEGKRAFRVYSIWDIPKSEQAKKTQKWQLAYFYQINELTNLNSVKALYKNKVQL
jgi:hypothetical protein